ncbi:MAG: hypothetical protein KF729_35470 [Sandaracinaceae bacterium]|nr:hypothetical protein [Sandaracinaceae bacterium]
MSRVVVAALAAALSLGCSVLFEPSVPDVCVDDDFDLDGWLAPECAPVGARPERLDCDDTDPEVFPGAPERCNGDDDDCDGRVDEGIATEAWYPDCDLDGAGHELAGAYVGCAEPDDPPCAGGGGRWVTRGGDCDDGNAQRRTACGECGEVDFLIVMDPTLTAAEQAALAAQIPQMVHVLKTGDVDGDGIADGEPVTRAHVGVITSDLGVAGHAVLGCDAGAGDDGRLRTRSGAALGCDELALEGLPYLWFTPEDTDSRVDGFAHDWACLVRTGTSACGFQQPLEATLKAITPAASSLRFEGETLGHGDGVNRGFLREGSLLVVLYLTAGDDCSVRDSWLFEGGASDGSAALRCHANPDALHPLSRFVSGLLQLRGADDLIFALVAGVPDDLLVAHGIDPDYRAILGDARLVERQDPRDPTRLVPSCTGRIDARPPRRLLGVASDLSLRGSTTVVGSICDTDAYRNVAEAVLATADAHRLRRCGPSLGE